MVKVFVRNGYPIDVESLRNIEMIVTWELMPRAKKCARARKPRIDY